MIVELAGSLLSRALGLTDKQIKLLLRAGWVLSVTTTGLWITGVFAFMGVGVAPFAAATEVKELRTTVTSIQVKILEESLFDVRLRQCKAETAESRQFYYGRLLEKMNEYYNLTERNWHPPTCAEIS